MKTSSVVLGILIGGAIGAIIGVLYAPDAGSNTRKKVMDEGEKLADEWKGKVRDKVNYYREQAADAVDRFAEKIHTQEPGTRKRTTPTSDI